MEKWALMLGIFVVLSMIDLFGISRSYDGGGLDGLRSKEVARFCASRFVVSFSN